MSAHFWSRVNKDGPVPDHAPELGQCWIWTGPTERGGYGKYSAGPFGTRVAHRVAYELLVGPIPEGLELDHLCRVRSCVRAPDHLEPVTRAENCRRQFVLVTHCPQGHEYDEANTYGWLNKRGDPCRQCKTCKQERNAALVLCDCGITVRTDYLTRHRRTAVHAAAKRTVTPPI